MIEQFSIQEGNPIKGKLIYDPDELSFDFIGLQHEENMDNEAALAVASTLQLAVSSESGRILYPWGYFPLNNLRKANLSIPRSAPGKVEVSSTELKSGITYTTSLDNSDELLYDPMKKIVVIGDSQFSPLIVVADGLYLGIDSNGTLHSLWLVWQ